jgi:nucleotide-binding universal stress UspA family protein
MDESGRMRVLIGYDGTPGAVIALEHVCRGRAGLPQTGEASVLAAADLVTLVPDVTPIGEVSDGDSPREAAHALALAEEQVTARARAVAEEGARRVRQALPGWTVQSDTVLGPAAEAMIDKATQWRADLIVLGWRGQSRVSRWLLGSVAQQVVNEAPCSVRLVRGRCGPAGSPVSMVIGYDGSPGAEAAVYAMAARTWPMGSAAWLVAVTSEGSGATWVSPSADFSAAFWKELEAHHLRWINRHARHGARILQEAGLISRVLLKAGDPKRVLVEESERWDADCLVVGASGSRGLTRLLMGSVATAVTIRAASSVEVVRPSAYMPQAVRTARIGADGPLLPTGVGTTYA